MESLIELLASDGYVIVNKELATRIGLNEALLIGELISEYRYYRNREELTEDGYFFSTIENIENNTTLNEYAQRKAVKHLMELEILSVERRKDGLRFFKINSEKLEEYLKINDGSLKFKDPETKNLKNRFFKNSGQIIITKNNKNNIEVDYSGKQVSTHNNQPTYYNMKDLSIDKLKQLKQEVLENRNSKSKTYKQLQQKYHLVENITYNTPEECDVWIQRKQLEQNGQRWY